MRTRPRGEVVADLRALNALTAHPGWRLFVAEVARLREQEIARLMDEHNQIAVFRAQGRAQMATDILGLIGGEAPGTLQRALQALVDADEGRTT